MTSATLIIFSGLPGVGKTTLARALASKLGYTHLRIDTIEQALRDFCDWNVEDEGYRLAYRLAADNLRVGVNVIADSCNPIELTRTEWRQVAIDIGAKFVDIEVCCSDRVEHRNRVEARTDDINGHQLPSWHDVEARSYEPWNNDRLVVDTAGKSVAECLIQVTRELAR